MKGQSVTLESESDAPRANRIAYRKRTRIVRASVSSNCGSSQAGLPGCLSGRQKQFEEVLKRIGKRAEALALEKIESIDRKSG
jgi:hypothetical protein